MSCDGHTVRLFQLQNFETGFTLVLHRRPHSAKQFLLRVHLTSAWREASLLYSVPLKSCKNEMSKLHSARTGREGTISLATMSVFLRPKFVSFSLLFKSKSTGGTYSSTTCTGAPPCYRTSALQRTKGCGYSLGSQSASLVFTFTLSNLMMFI